MSEPVVIAIIMGPITSGLAAAAAIIAARHSRAANTELQGNGTGVSSSKQLQAVRDVVEGLDTKLDGHIAAPADEAHR